MHRTNFTIWGEYKDKRMEALYLQGARQEFVRRNRIAFLLAGIGFALVSVADFMKLGFVSETVYTAATRYVYFFFSLFLYIYFSKKRSLSQLTSWSFLWFLYYVFMINLLIYWLNPDHELDLIDGLTVPLCTLLFYIFLQLPLRLLLVGGVSVSVLYLCLVHFYVKTSLDGFFILLVLLIIINFLGFYIPRMQGQLKRIDFMKNKTIQDLNRTLKREMEERLVTQHKLETAYNEINDSVKYARQIQFAMFPDSIAIKKMYTDYFIVHRPLNMLSGDFYWCHSHEDCSFFAVADCTGHGVPGALMSMLGITSLNEIVKNKGVVSPNQILDLLRNEIIFMLHQNDVGSASRDGMDMALCCVNKKEMKLYFSGALNHLYIVRDNNDIMELKGDKMPIGYFYGKSHNYSVQEFNLIEGDALFLSTDGLIDQFGGPQGKRFSSRRLKELLVDMAKYPFKHQKTIVENNIDQWMQGGEQVDDILFVGLKI